MKKLIFSFSILIMLAGFTYAVESTGPDYLFVINFDNGTYENGKLTIKGNGQSNVIYFSDSPEVEAGHMGIKKFVSIWGEGEENFNTIPPNCTLSVIKDEVENNSVFILSNPKVDGAAITFDAELVSGKLAPKFEAGGLFVDTKLGKNKGD
jgi:hypothetical protein